MSKPLPEKITREWVRENLPATTAIADSFRDTFGAGVVLTYAEENGYQLGERDDLSGRKVVSGQDLNVAPLPGPETMIDRRK